MNKQGGKCVLLFLSFFLFFSVEEVFFCFHRRRSNRQNRINTEHNGHGDEIEPESLAFFLFIYKDMIACVTSAVIAPLFLFFVNLRIT